MKPSNNRAVRNAQRRLTASFISKLGLMLVAGPIVAAVLGMPAHLGHIGPAMRLLLGLWWAGLGAYLVALGLVLVGRLR